MACLLRKVSLSKIPGLNLRTMKETSEYEAGQAQMKTYLEVEEVTMMEKAATNPRDSLLIRILFRLGCRVSEALALKVQDIDFERCVVTIEHLKYRRKLSCPQCEERLGRHHQFCPCCGVKVD